MTDRDYPVSSYNDPEDVPVDLETLRADDRLLDALSRNQVPGNGLDTGSADYQLASLLAGWRHEIDAHPMPINPTLDEVEAEIARTRRTGSRHTAMKRLRIVGAAAAFMVVAGGAVTVLAQNSNPGDPLWSVKEVMFGSEASQTVASADAQSSLEKAEQALSSGDKRKAAELLLQAQQNVGGMSGTDSQQRMQDWMQRLASQVGPIPNNPLTALTSLPSISGLPPLQLPPEITDPAIASSIIDKGKQLLDRQARPRPSGPSSSDVTTTTTPPPASSNAPSQNPTTTTTTTALVPR